jgi:phosphoesterase RecJ-like protein
MILLQSAISFKDIILSHNNVLIVSHERPDGDSISSLLSLRELICSINSTEVTLVSPNGVPKAFRFLPGAQDILSDFLCGDFDLVVTVDCGDLRRTGFADRISKMLDKKVTLVNVDHHPKNDLHKLSALNIFDSGAASATEIIYQLICMLKVQINPNLATMLYTGLFTDTGSFQHPVTTSKVLSAASELLASGAKFKELRQNLTYNKSLPMLKLWGLVLERIKINKYNFAVSVITNEDMAKIGANEEDLAGVVNLLESIPECCAAMLLVEVEPNVIRGSLRSNKSKIDVSGIAKLLDGGGHPRAAGFTYNGHIELDKDGWKVV